MTLLALFSVLSVLFNSFMKLTAEYRLIQHVPNNKMKSKFAKALKREKEIMKHAEEIKEAAAVLGLGGPDMDIEADSLLRMARQVKGRVGRTYKQVSKLIRRGRAFVVRRNLGKCLNRRVTKLVHEFNRSLAFVVVNQIQRGGENDDESEAHL